MIQSVLSVHTVAPPSMSNMEEKITGLITLILIATRNENW